MVRRIAEVHKIVLQRQTANPTAVVVKGLAEFGIVRMWEMLSEEMFPNHTVFYSKEEALDWLLKGKRPL